MIHVEQGEDLFSVAKAGLQRLDGAVQVVKHRTLLIVADHRLDPQERGLADAAGDRGDAVQAAGGIEHQMPGRELHPMLAIGVFNHQFATLIALRIAKEQRR